MASKIVLISLRVIESHENHREHRFGKLKGCRFASSTSFLDAAAEAQEYLTDPEMGGCNPLNHPKKKKKINHHSLW